MNIKKEKIQNISIIILIISIILFLVVDFIGEKITNNSKASINKNNISTPINEVLSTISDKLNNSNNQTDPTLNIDSSENIVEEIGSDNDSTTTDDNINANINNSTTNASSNSNSNSTDNSSSTSKPSTGNNSSSTGSTKPTEGSSNNNNNKKKNKTNIIIIIIIIIQKKILALILKITEEITIPIIPLIMIKITITPKMNQGLEMKMDLQPMVKAIVTAMKMVIVILILKPHNFWESR